MKTVNAIYSTIRYWFDPALEGNPYQKEESFIKTRKQAKNKGWFFHRWARV